MNADIEKLCVALDAFATTVINAWGNDTTMVEAVGWHSPALTRHDLAAIPQQLARDLRSAGPDIIDDATATLVRDFPRRLILIQQHTLPQMFGGNSPQSVPAYLGAFMCLRQLMSPLLDWQGISDPKVMPAALARRVRSLQAELNQLVPKKEDLEVQLADISRAHAAAESLPVDLQALSEARTSLNEAVSASTERLKEASKNSTESFREIEFMKTLKSDAEKILALCEEAYRASTSRGLAAAFDQRATSLGRSMVAWIFGLLLALGVAAIIGGERFKILSIALSAPDIRWGVIVMQTLISLTSIGAPIWFGWLATKQIGQRFRLAEDYSFKAAVARAYEGYRKEAARIDPLFESRLFNSALTRLEEAPLRLVETTTHGSPWHELIESEAFNKALDLVPELGAQIAGFKKSTMKNISNLKPKGRQEKVGSDQVEKAETL